MVSHEALFFISFRYFRCDYFQEQNVWQEVMEFKEPNRSNLLSYFQSMEFTHLSLVRRLTRPS